MTANYGLARALAATLEGIPPGELAEASARAPRAISLVRTSRLVGDARATLLESGRGRLGRGGARLPGDPAPGDGGGDGSCPRRRRLADAVLRADKSTRSRSRSWRRSLGSPASVAVHREVILIDHDRRMIGLGQRLATAGDELDQASPAALGDQAPPAAQWKWRLSSITSDELPPADVVTAGYVLGELDLASALEVAEAAWRAARKLLVVVGPGTPAGFERIRAVRDRLLAAGAEIVAPCPHAYRCPILEPDWCHFAARVERSQLHRSLKSGRLSYEDEKFSYVALAPAPDAAPIEGRVLGAPSYGATSSNSSCAARTAGSVPSASAARKSSYRSARSLRWGDAAPTRRHLSSRDRRRSASGFPPV